MSYDDWKTTDERDTRPDGDYCVHCGAHYTSSCDESCPRLVCSLTVKYCQCNRCAAERPPDPREEDRLARIALKVKR